MYISATKEKYKTPPELKIPLTCELCILFVLLHYVAFFGGSVESGSGLLGQGPLFKIAKEALIDELENFNFTNLAYRYTYRYLQK